MIWVVPILFWIDYSQALICADTIIIKESDMGSRLNHMLASLDYWVFDIYWFNEDGSVLGKEKDRSTFIEMMENVSNSKANRVRNKKTKEKGLALSPENRKTLSMIAKKQGKTQAQMLNDIVASYNQTFFNKVSKTIGYVDAYISGDYGERYTDSFDTEQSQEAKQVSPEMLANETEDIKTLESASHTQISDEAREHIEDIEKTKSAKDEVEEIVENNESHNANIKEDIKLIEQCEYDYQSNIFEYVANHAKLNSVCRTTLDINPFEDVVTAVHVSERIADEPAIGPNFNESNLDSADSLDKANEQIAEDDPFSRNAKIIRDKRRL